MRALFLGAVAVLFVVRCASAFRNPLQRKGARALGATAAGDGADKVGYIIVDHGSKREKANQVVFGLAEEMRKRLGTDNVQPAHMELAEPSIQEAFDRCVKAGATHVVCHPYFLSPGRHVMEDIPELVEEASKAHGGVTYQITKPLGALPGILDLIELSISSAKEA